jgi:ClpX C4-type zinc finger
MSSADDRRKLIQQYLATQRQISEIERKALEKMGSKQTGKPTCSFCGKAENDVPMLIEGDNAYICSDCVRSVGGMLDGEAK